MIIVRDIEQGSPEWHRLRLDVPTASEFSRIITPATGKPSAQAKGYRRTLLAQWLTGKPIDGFNGDWMKHGHEVEDEARSFYEMMYEVETVGFCYLDERLEVGCSPDGLVGEGGGLEIKCPAPHTHIGYLLDQKLPTDYIPQVQGSMWVTGRAWWDFVSYCPGIDPLILRIDRDEAYISKLAKLVGAFVETLNVEKQELIERGFAHQEVFHAA